MRNETPRGLVQCLLKIRLEIGFAINALQECHNTGAAKPKRLKSAQMAIKKHLTTLQDEIAKGYNTPEKDEYVNQDDETSVKTQT